MNFNEEMIPGSLLSTPSVLVGVSTPRHTYRRLTRAIIVAGFLMAIPLTRQPGIG
jgi:hypothetical protein